MQDACQKPQTDTENVVHEAEIIDWLRAFVACRATAFHHVPNLVFSYLRHTGMLDPECDVTDEGMKFLQEAA